MVNWNKILPFSNKQKTIEKFSIPNSVTKLTELQTITNKQKCPYCGDALILRGLENGANGLEAQVACICGLGGVINSTGFTYKHLPRRAAKTEARK